MSLAKSVQIGFRPGTEPAVEDGYELWSLNTFHSHLPDGIVPTAWFQIHRPEDLRHEVDGHFEWLCDEHPFPIYMNNPAPFFRSAVELPVEELKKLWTFTTQPSFASSFSWMVAMAIHLKYKRIRLGYVFLVSKRETYLELPNLCLWLGLAAGQGIQVDVSTSHMVAQTYMYGYEPRRIPWWAPSEVAHDVITDYNRATRDWRGAWRRGYMETGEDTFRPDS